MALVAKSTALASALRILRSSGIALCPEGALVLQATHSYRVGAKLSSDPYLRIAERDCLIITNRLHFEFPTSRQTRSEALLSLFCATKNAQFRFV